MGGSKSTPQTETPPPGPFFNSKKELLDKNLRELKLSDSNVKYIRILLVGEIGAGKSSFINSVNSAFLGRITTEALADSGSGESFTKAFNPSASDKNSDCKSETSPEDLTYCLVYVIAADKVSLMNHEVFKKMKDIRQKASSLEIPQAVIMTRVDEACPLVKKSLRKIYTSKKIKEKMQQCSNSVGVPVSHIFPVRNYHEEIDTQNDMDVLIMRALTQIVHIADDLLNRRKSDSKK
ncbi:interferon-induced protein 44-like [Sinocyclocheilus rhinocerous]|uniref:interferon-induced protein 44-like n=1 Tax=Sinocyclocheilus rhinocerous TaxID=307959 RepID=UPI0007BA93A7|nr:PREDICTED: interferon-induced protein 44-like [Sinocyclocheilus rhinocerous]